MKRATLILAVLALAPFVAGQVAVTPAAIDGPVQHLGTIHYATGTMVPPSGADDCVLVYDNTTTNGYFYKPGTGYIEMDWGTLAAAPNNEVCGFSFGYASQWLVPVDMIIRIHEGATGYGNPGVVVGAYLFTGLPGASTPGGTSAYAFDVDLTGAEFLIADGPIGWSYEFGDPSTGPLLVGPPNGPGVADALDSYLSDFTYVSTWWFGGAPPASLFFALNGQEQAVAVELQSMTAVYNEGAVNVCWTTSSEIDTAGFLVEEGLSKYGPFRRMTGLIPAAGGPFQAADYCTSDSDVQAGPTPWYRLRDISVTGESTWHNPVRTAEWPNWRVNKPVGSGSVPLR
jgi:hypothetical protein